MKIFTAAQTHELDRATIENEDITSLELMERAARRFVNWFFLQEGVSPELTVNVLCGTGNNGGDGLAIARILQSLGFEVNVYLLRISDSESEDFQENYQVAKDLFEIIEVESTEDLDDIEFDECVIDAVFGSGLNRPLDEDWADILEYASDLAHLNISVDIPSGLFADRTTEVKGFRADFTASFQYPKIAFFLPENQDAVGKWHLLDINLDEVTAEQTETDNFYIDADTAAEVIKERKAHDHKGTFGHALVIAGSYGKVGAATLCARAVLRAGAGLVTVHAPKCAYQILQISFPEAMVEVDKHEFVFSDFDDEKEYAAVGIGPGLGTNEVTISAFARFLEKAKQPLVLDADALNILAKQPDLLSEIPEESILTPHPKEAQRLFGEFENDFDRLEKLRKIAADRKIFIVLKGGSTVVLTPSGRAFFNNTGNPGMATGGTGDVLTGILTGLVAQGYSSLDACLAGVYLHGLAGDIAAEMLEQESLLSSDVAHYLGRAFKRLRSKVTEKGNGEAGVLS